MRKLIKVITIFAIVLTFSGVSKATLEPIGDPIELNSWAQRFTNSEDEVFDLIAVKMNSVGDSFESVSLYDFVPPSWNLSMESLPPSPIISAATGPAVTPLDLTIKFAGDKDDPLTFTFVAFSGDQLLSSTEMIWSGTGWSGVAGTWAPTRSELDAVAIEVPEPATITILALGGLGMLRRRIA